MRKLERQLKAEKNTAAAVKNADLKRIRSLEKELKEATLEVRSWREAHDGFFSEQLGETMEKTFGTFSTAVSQHQQHVYRPAESHGAVPLYILVLSCGLVVQASR